MNKHETFYKIIKFFKKENQTLPWYLKIIQFIFYPIEYFYYITNKTNYNFEDRTFNLFGSKFDYNFVRFFKSEENQGKLFRYYRKDNSIIIEPAPKPTYTNSFKDKEELFLWLVSGKEITNENQTSSVKMKNGNLINQKGDCANNLSLQPYNWFKKYK